MEEEDRNIGESGLDGEGAAMARERAANGTGWEATGGVQEEEEEESFVFWSLAAVNRHPLPNMKRAYCALAQCSRAHMRILQ